MNFRSTPLLKVIACSIALLSTSAMAVVNDGDVLANGALAFSGSIVADNDDSTCTFDNPTLNIDLGNWDRSDEGESTFTGQKVFSVQLTCDGGNTGIQGAIEPADDSYTVSLSKAGTVRVQLFASALGSDNCQSDWSDESPIRFTVNPDEDDVNINTSRCAMIDQVSNDADGNLSLTVPLTVTYLSAK